MGMADSETPPVSSAACCSTINSTGSVRRRCGVGDAPAVGRQAADEKHAQGHSDRSAGRSGAALWKLKAFTCRGPIEIDSFLPHWRFF